jgi:hypothetical protein
VSANWFPKNERIRATSVGAYANILGIGIGCFFPFLFLSLDKYEKKDSSIAEQHIF